MGPSEPLEHCTSRHQPLRFQRHYVSARAINRLLVGLFIDPVPESKPKFDLDALTCLICPMKMVIEHLVLVLVIRIVHARVTLPSLHTIALSLST
mgnify:CR=1 FL=1